MSPVKHSTAKKEMAFQLLFQVCIFFPRANAIEITKLPNISQQFNSIQQKGELVIYNPSKNLIRQIVRGMYSVVGVDISYASVAKMPDSRYFIFLPEGEVSKIVAYAVKNKEAISCVDEFLSYELYCNYSIVRYPSPIY